MDNIQNINKVKSIVDKANGKALNLQQTYITNFWANKSKEQTGIASRLAEMDKCENWTREDNVEITHNLSEFAKVLSDMNINNEAFVSDQQIENLIKILAYLKSSYVFRIINWLDENRNTVMIKLIVFAMESAQTGTTTATGHITPEGILLERMSALNLLGMIQEIFNPEVTKLIKQTLFEFEDKERGVA